MDLVGFDRMPSQWINVKFDAAVAAPLNCQRAMQFIRIGKSHIAVQFAAPRFPIPMRESRTQFGSPFAIKVKP